MTHTNNPARFSGRLRHALANISFLYRVNIHRRLTLCFIFVIALMLVGNGVLLSVYDRLGVLARSEDSARLLKESVTLRKSLLDDAQRTLVTFNHLPPE